jgi:pimeloyl-ACP methyl ester carboxylesterase
LTAPANCAIGPKPDDLELEDVEFETADGHRVRGWWRRGERGKGAVVLLHPKGDDRRSMLGRARLLAEQGVGALLVDLRAHGETRGQRITFGLKESADAHAAVRAARELGGGERVGAVGFSLGGASALLGERPVEVDALVLEAVYPSLTDAIEARIAMRMGRLPSKLLAPLFVAQVRPRLGAPISALRPIDGIRRLTSPVLVAGGARDPKTPFPQTRRLYAAAPEPKELWRVEGAEHEDFLARDPAGYRERVLGFLRRHLGKTARSS